jgi:hypothetical protein
MAEFCPRCTAPLETDGDSSRLCEVCGWFGDSAEALSKPPRPDRINPVLAAAQCLDLYRDVCRKELIAEQIYDAGNATEADIRTVRTARRYATNAIIELFAGLHKLAHPQNPPTPQKRRILRSPNGLVPWPDDFAPGDRHYNASNEPCDMLVGPCSCGAWHCEEEPWVQALLVKYNAEIVDE